MKRFVVLTASLFFSLFVIISCSKEGSFEAGQRATGSLQDDASGNCLPKTVQGTYIAGKALIPDSNYIEVQVNVVSGGSYTITTDTVNGFSFAGSGSFSGSGLNTVRLKGSGTPLAAASTIPSLFTVRYDSSFCTVPVTVLGTSNQAVYTLQGSGATCGNFAPAGSYTAGTSLTSTNTVSVDVNVTTPGTYTITTNTVNGYSFSGSGAFTNIGAQTVVLTGTGKPAANGTDVFTVTAGSSSCTFSITVGGTTTPSADYFPLTQNSYWTYDDVQNSDTIKTVVSGTSNLIGKTYQRFVTSFPGGSYSTYYRKDASTNYYYQLIDTASLGLGQYGIKFSQAQFEVQFLRATLSTGTTWNNDINITIGGVPAVLRFTYTCSDANASLTVFGKTFTNVYKVTNDVYIVAAGQSTPVNQGYVSYYAKGIGFIKDEDTTGVYDTIRYWQVF